MQYLEKQNTEPNDWNKWFTVPPNRRSYDYAVDSSSLPQLRLAKQHLIVEQNELCAYCQQKIDVDNSSIEHVTPKEHNKELSTSYHNLVAVCNKNQIRDNVTQRFHCDRNRGSELVTPIIFYSNSKSTIDNINSFFTAYSNGEIIAKQTLESNVKNQVEAFINLLNLNHNTLKEKRAKDTLNGLTKAYAGLAKGSNQKRNFWGLQYNRILQDQRQPFREYLLIYIGSKIGLN